MKSFRRPKNPQAQPLFVNKTLITIILHPQRQIKVNQMTNATKQLMN